MFSVELLKAEWRLAGKMAWFVLRLQYVWGQYAMRFGGNQRDP